MTSVAEKLPKLTEAEIADKIEKIMLELQLVLCNNTKTNHRENILIMLAVTSQLYALVSKKYVNSRANFLYNSGVAWDQMDMNDMQEVTFQ